MLDYKFKIDIKLNFFFFPNSLIPRFYFQYLSCFNNNATWSFIIIEEFFSDLKDFIRREFRNYTGHSFRDFLEWCVDIVEAQEESVQDHFRHAGLTVEES